MTTPDELLPLVERILNSVGEDGSALERWGQTVDGQKVIQYVVQIGKYNTNLGEGTEFSIGDQLDRPILEEIRDLLRSQLVPSPPEIDWQQVSRSLLNEQIQRLTTNPLTRPENIALQTEQVYVPLGLVERKKVSRRGEDVSPEQGSLLYEETEITRKFEHEEFLEQVLQRGQSPRSRGRRIAVIGEPGAGKTTLLQQMARWVAENVEGAIAIWVSLADLQGRSVEDYLLEQWLRAVVQQQGQAEASTLVKDAFVAQVNAERVWLLLDGVDEMPVATGNPLGEMERQVRLGGLLAQARMVLTCRLNLWDGDRHALDSFDVYRTLEFAYPGQVEQFVGQWFGALPEVQEGQAKKLCEALGQPGRERLRDLVKNPLRLTLLCFNWYLGEGTLPETKAGLYEQFVTDFYEWKRERFPTTAVQRGRLNAALGELAREAIDKEETRFRLRHDFVCKYLGETDEPDSLFQMALRLGWLNQIGVDSENRRNIVYAFFHPTFQEYFAALEIANRFRGNSLSFEQLRDGIFGKYWQENAWYEPLLLICGMIDAQSSGKLIDFLTQMYPENGQQISRQELWDKWDRGEDLYEEYIDTDDFLLKTLGGENLFFAASCYRQTRDRHEIQEISIALFERLTDINDYVQIYHDQGISMPDLDWSVATYISIIETVAENWQGQELGYSYLVSEAMESGLQEFCIAAILSLSTYWSDSPTFVKDLIKIVQYNHFHSMNDSYEDSYESVDYLDSPRQVAMKTLMKHYPTHPEVLSLLQDRAINDEDEQVRQWASKQLRR